MLTKDKGKKHTCQSCSALFYDFKHKPIICPKCGTKVEAQSLLKTRRSITQTPKPSVEKIKKTAVVESNVEDLEVDVEVDDKDEDDLIEDMSDMDDDDDMSEVKDHMSSNSDDKD